MIYLCSFVAILLQPWMTCPCCNAASAMFDKIIRNACHHRQFFSSLLNLIWFCYIDVMHYFSLQKRMSRTHRRGAYPIKYQVPCILCEAKGRIFFFFFSSKLGMPQHATKMDIILLQWSALAEACAHINKLKQKMKKTILYELIWKHLEGLKNWICHPDCIVTVMLSEQAGSCKCSNNWHLKNAEAVQLFRISCLPSMS